MKKKVLIVAANATWPGISRLPQALSNSGLEVSALCPKGSFLSFSNNIKDCVEYPIFTYSRTKIIYFSVFKIILNITPDLIVPGDEESVIILQNLAKICRRIPGLHKIHLLIRKSLYPEIHDELVLQKDLFISMCHRLNIRAPQNEVISKPENILSHLGEIDYPIVLKSSSGYGGSGVTICETSEELEEAIFIKKRSLLGIIKKIMRSIFFVNLLDTNDTLSLQQCLEGDIGLCSFFAYKGELCAANPMLKLRTYPNKTSPSCVVKSFHNDEVIDFLKRIIKEIEYTGFGAIDFIIEEKSKQPYLIELNPRPVPICHFGGEIANDLSSYLLMALEGKKAPYRTDFDSIVALFPNELNRDPNSEFIKKHFHDIPQNEDRLKSELLK